MSENNTKSDHYSDNSDADLYAFMKAFFPEGGQMLSEEEKESFMKKHGIGKCREKK